MDNLKIKTLSKEIKLPSNIEAEQALIGSILVNNDIIDEVSSITNNNEFYDPLQFVQWTFMGKAKSPILNHIIEYIKKYHLPKYPPGKDPVSRTGPVAFTAAILDFMKVHCGYRQSTQMNDVKASHFFCNEGTKIVILPYRAFATPGYHPKGIITTGKILIRHHFKGSWKN